jgi:hypothetical protein
MVEICLPKHQRRRQNLQNDRLAYTEITMDIACAEKVGVTKRLYIVSIRTL